LIIKGHTLAGFDFVAISHLNTGEKRLLVSMLTGVVAQVQPESLCGASGVRCDGDPSNFVVKHRGIIIGAWHWYLVDLRRARDTMHVEARPLPWWIDVNMESAESHTRLTAIAKESLSHVFESDKQEDDEPDTVRFTRLGFDISKRNDGNEIGDRFIHNLLTAVDSTGDFTRKNTDDGSVQDLQRIEMVLK